MCLHQGPFKQKTKLQGDIRYMRDCAIMFSDSHLSYGGMEKTCGAFVEKTECEFDGKCKAHSQQGFQGEIWKRFY